MCIMSNLLWSVRNERERERGEGEGEEQREIELSMQLESHAQGSVRVDWLEGWTSSRVVWRSALEISCTALYAVLAGTVWMLKLSVVN